MQKLALLVLPALVGGCDDGLTMEQYAPELSASFCEKVFECCSEAEIANLEVFLNPISNEEDCEEELATLIDVVELIWGEAEREGRLEFDPEAAQDCLDAYASLSCDDFVDAYEIDAAHNVDACMSPVKPLVEAGGACAEDYECVGEAECDGGSIIFASGICVPLPAQGESCTWTCQTGLYCNYDPALADDVCASIPEIGEACDGVCDDDAFCDFTATPFLCASIPALGDECDDYCAEYTFCDWRQSPPICATLPAVGETCIEDCAEGGWCDTDQGPPVCVEQLASGAACQRHNQCLSLWCGYDPDLGGDFCHASTAGCF